MWIPRAKKTYEGKLIKSIEKQPYPLQVYENWRFRWLSFGSDYIQTVIRKRSPEKPTLSYIKALCLMLQASPGSTLVLGVGGAGVLHYIDSILPSQTIKAVEIDPNIIQLAREYFYLSRLKNVEIIIDDASRFVKQPQPRYQHILIDLYQSTEYPKTCSDLNFFQDCHKLLKPGGVLSLNMVEFNQQQQLFRNIRQVFDNQTLISSVTKKSNVIVHAIKEREILHHAEQLRKRNLLTKIQWLEGYGLYGV